MIMSTHIHSHSHSISKNGIHPITYYTHTCRDALVYKHAAAEDTHYRTRCSLIGNNLLSVLGPDWCRIHVARLGASWQRQIQCGDDNNQLPWQHKTTTSQTLKKHLSGMGWRNDQLELSLTVDTSGTPLLRLRDRRVRTVTAQEEWRKLCHLQDQAKMHTCMYM